MDDSPVNITGFTFVRSIGSFPIGDSLLFTQAEPPREVHVLLGRDLTGVSELMAKFDAAVGDAAHELILYAGLTDRGRPYLVTSFLDDQLVESTFESSRDTEIVDHTVLSSRSAVDDATQLSAPRATTTGAPSADCASVQPPLTRQIPSLVVSEREARIPDPSHLAETDRYVPRQIGPDTSVSDLKPDMKVVPQETIRVAPRVSRLREERRRAQRSLAAIGVSIALSAVGAVLLGLWLLIR